MRENNFVPSTSSNREEPRNKISRKKCFQEAWFEEFPSWKDWVVRLEDEKNFIVQFATEQWNVARHKF